MHCFSIAEVSQIKRLTFRGVSDFYQDGLSFRYCQQSLGRGCAFSCLYNKLVAEPWCVPETTVHFIAQNLSLCLVTPRDDVAPSRKRRKGLGAQAIADQDEGDDEDDAEDAPDSDDSDKVRGLMVWDRGWVWDQA